MGFDALITRPSAGAVSLKDYAYIADWDGIFSPPPFRGADVVVPDARGQEFAPQPYDAYTFEVPLEVIGTSQADFQDRLANLRALVESSRTGVVFSRRFPTGAGDLTTSCYARCKLTASARNGLYSGRASLEVLNLDGCFYGPALTPTIPATITNPGSGPTNRITLVLPGAGTLTNTTLGVAVTVTAGATLDVENKTTTGSLAALSATGDPFAFWFALGPGSNAITWSGSGTPTISYHAAYL